MFIVKRSLLFLGIYGLFSACGLGAMSLVRMGDMPFPISWAPMRIPKWTHGAIIDVQYADNATNPLIWVVERQRTYTIPFTISGATSMTIYDWDRSPDGKDIGFSGSAMDTDGRSAYFIARISSDGATSVITRENRYIPRRIVFAPDGDLWTAGLEWKGSGNASVFRHYDRSGKLAGAFVPQSTFSDLVVLFEHGSRLMASNDRIGWYSPRANRYMEISFQGSVLTALYLAPPDDRSNGYNLALTGKGDLLISSMHSVPAVDAAAGPVSVWSISTLDRASNTWKPILQRSITRQNRRDFGHIYGIDYDVSGDVVAIAGDNRVMFFSITN